MYPVVKRGITYSTGIAIWLLAILIFGLLSPTG